MMVFDYVSILNRLRENLKEGLGENSELLLSSTNQRILEAVAEELQEQVRYNEYLTREAKWDTSQNLSSVLSQIGFFNYLPHRMIGAVGELIVSTSPTFNASYPNKILIPKFTEFASDGLTFCSTQDRELLNNMETSKIPIVQGFFREYTYEVTHAYDPSELVGFSIEINNPKIDNFNYDLTVNGILWTRVEHFGYAEGPEDTVYEIRNKNDFSGIIVQFGDSIQGKGVEYGDVIRFRCVETEGKQGEVLKTQAVTTVVSTIRDVLNNRVALYCTNNSPIESGDSYESIDSIKYNAPRALRLSSRLISKTDYQAFLVNEGYADKVIVWGETEVNIDSRMPLGTFIPHNENLIFVAGINIASDGSGVPLSEAEQIIIRDAVAPIKSITDIIQFKEPKITYLRFKCEIGFTTERYTQDQVTEAVTNVLMQTYALEHPERRFKESLYYSQFYELINALPQVVWHQTELTMIQYPQWEVSEVTGDVIPYTFKIDFDHSFIFKDSVKVFIRNRNIHLPNNHPYKDWFLVTTFDDEGKFVPETIPTYTDDSNYEIPDAGSLFTFSTPSQDDYFDYIKGRFIEDEEVTDPETVEIQIANGVALPGANTLDYEIKLEFDGGTEEGAGILRTNVIPNQRYQMFACEFVYIDNLHTITAEEEMGYY